MTKVGTAKDKHRWLAPTPWRVEEEPNHEHWTNSISIFDADGGEIAVFTRGYEGDENNDGCESFTNARICAAAPSMLDTLREVDRVIAGCHGFGLHFEKMREKVRAAIIAAEPIK